MGGVGDATARLSARIAHETAGFQKSQGLSALDRYLMDAAVEPHAAIRLGELPYKYQQAVLAQGSLKGAKELTLLLLGIIASVTAGASCSEIAGEAQKDAKEEAKDNKDNKDKDNKEED